MAPARRTAQRGGDPLRAVQQRSCIAVYDEKEVRALPVRETAQLLQVEPGAKPKDRYGAMKAKCESLLLDTSDLAATIVRPVFVYGPFNYVDREQYFFRKALMKETIYVPDRCVNVLPLVYVDDLASAFVSVLKNPDTYGNCYNVQGDEVVTLMAFIRICSEAVDPTAAPRIQILDKAEQRTASTGRDFPFRTDFSAVYDTSRLRVHTGWRPTTGLSHGLLESFQWHKRSGLLWGVTGWQDAPR